jgi:hypothetical protein
MGHQSALSEATHPLKGNRKGTPCDWTKEILLIDRFFFQGGLFRKRKYTEGLFENSNQEI